MEAVWLLSPEFPDGLEITGPRDVEVGYYSLSQDGSTLYAYVGGTSVGLRGESLGPPDALWMTPLSADPDWQLVAEGINIVGKFRLAGPSDPASDYGGKAQTLPAQDFATPVTTPSATLDPLFPANAIPIFDPGPIDELSPDRQGGVSEAGLTIPLRNGDVVTLPDAVRISHALHTDIDMAIVEDADGNQVSLDLNTGEILAELHPSSDTERLIGTYQFIPDNDDMTVWRILDLRTGDEITTEAIFGGPFEFAASPIPVTIELAHPSTVLVQFVTGGVGGEREPLSTESSTLLIPGNLDSAAFTDQNHGDADRFLAQPVALPTDEDTALFAYVTDMPDQLIQVENVVTGESIATFSADDINAGRELAIAGFNNDGTLLVVWTRSTVSLLKLGDEQNVIPFDAGGGAPVQLAFPSETSAMVMMTEQTDTGAAPTGWKHLDFESGEWTDLPELDGFRWDRGYPGSPWMILMSGAGPTMSTVIVDRPTGEIAVRLDGADLGMSTARTPSRDFSVYVITGNTGQPETTGYVLDADSGESWQITPPDTDGTDPTGIFYSVSPDGSLLIATSRYAEEADGDGETWVSPVEPDADWTSIGPRSIDSWLYFPDDM